MNGKLIWISCLFIATLCLSASCNKDEPCDDIDCTFGFDCVGGECICNGYTTNDGTECHEITEGTYVLAEIRGFTNCLDDIVAIEDISDSFPDRDTLLCYRFTKENGVVFSECFNRNTGDGEYAVIWERAWQTALGHFPCAPSYFETDNFSMAGQSLAPTWRIKERSDEVEIRVDYYTLSGIDLEKQAVLVFRNE